MGKASRLGLARMAKEKVKVTPELLARAIAREPQAVHEFVAILTPIFWWRIGRVLLLSGSACRSDVEDLCQDTFVALLQNDGRLARSWDPARSSFENFSGLIAEHLAVESKRKKRAGLFHDSASYDDLEPVLDSSRAPERLVGSREMLRKVFDKLEAELSDLGRRLLELLFIEEREVDEVCVLMKMEKGAVYAWRSRLGRRIEEIMGTLGGAE